MLGTAPSSIRGTASLLAMAAAAIWTAPGAAQIASAGAPPASPQVEAQVQTSQAQDQQGGDGGEIVVTAQHRAERLQDVPASITAVSAATLSNAGVTNPTDIQYIAPTVTFNPQQGSGFQIRGVGSQGFDYSLEKSISTVVDDVVQGLPRTVGISTLADVERIEVLRGPQGTLFGKNASGGVIYVVTRRPQLDKTEVIGKYRYGTGNELQLQQVVNLPVTETLAARVAATYNRRDGFIRNTFLNKDLGGYSDLQLTGKLLWQATPDLEVYLIGDYLRHRDTGLGLVSTLRTLNTFTGTANTQDVQPFLNQYGVVPGPNNEKVALDQANYARFRTGAGTGIVTYHLGSGTLMSITGYKHLNYFQTLDSDQAPNNFFSFNIAPIFTASQTTQELRYTSPTGGFLDFTAGLYYYHQKVDAKEIQYGTFGRTLPANTYVSFVGADAYYTARATSYAAFTQGNLHFTDKLLGVVGLRYTHDRVRGTYEPRPDPTLNLIPQTVAFPAKGATTKADNLSGRATLQYRFSDRIMAFATYSRGYKAPAVGTTRGVVAPVKPEKSTNYEVGIKSELFDRVLTLNVTGFIEKFRNFQTQTLVTNADNSLTFQLANAEALRSSGVEADARVRVTRALGVTVGAAYAPSKYTGFLTSCYAGQPVMAAPGRGCYRQGTTSIFDASGQPLILAPKYTISVSPDFKQELFGRYALTVNGTYAYRSKVYSVVGNPNTIVKGYGIVNGTIGFGPDSGAWRVGLYTRNLFDKHYVGRIAIQNYVAPASYSQLPVIDARRTIGGSIEYKF